MVRYGSRTCECQRKTFFWALAEALRLLRAGWGLAGFITA